MPPLPAAVELLATLAPVLARWGRWYLFGAQAVIAKILAGRPKDVDDARALWQLHGRELDADRIRRTLALLEEALSQSDLVSTLLAMARPPRSG